MPKDARRFIIASSTDICGPGNLRIAEDWAEVPLPEIDHQQELGKEVVFRADAAFAKPEIYEMLEERGVKYAIRLPSNDSLLRDIEELLRWKWPTAN